MLSDMYSLEGGVGAVSRCVRHLNCCVSFMIVLILVFSAGLMRVTNKIDVDLRFTYGEC